MANINHFFSGSAAQQTIRIASLGCPRPLSLSLLSDEGEGGGGRRRDGRERWFPRRKELSFRYLAAAVDATLGGRNLLFQSANLFCRPDGSEETRNESETSTSVA